MFNETLCISQYLWYSALSDLFVFERQLALLRSQDELWVDLGDSLRIFLYSKSDQTRQQTVMDKRGLVEQVSHRISDSLWHANRFCKSSLSNITARLETLSRRVCSVLAFFSHLVLVCRSN